LRGSLLQTLSLVLPKQLITSNNLQVKNFYAIPLAEKYKTLQAIDGEEFSNRVLGALNNEDVTETCLPFS